MLDSLNSEIVKNTSEPDSTPETKETVEPDDDLDQNSNISPEVPEKFIYSPSSLYVFFNSGNFNQLVLPESLRRLSRGEPGQLMINLKAYQLAKNEFPIFEGAGIDRKEVARWTASTSGSAAAVAGCLCPSSTSARARATGAEQVSRSCKLISQGNATA